MTLILGFVTENMPKNSCKSIRQQWPQAQVAHGNTRENEFKIQYTYADNDNDLYETCNHNIAISSLIESRNTLIFFPEMGQVFIEIIQHRLSSILFTSV